MTDDTELLNITSALGLEQVNTVPSITFLGEVSVEPLMAVEIIQEALTEVQQNLADFAASETFETDILNVFGESANVDLGQTIVDGLAAGEDLPQIIVVPVELMNGAAGGFDSLTGTVYLADSLINSNSVVASETSPVIGIETSSVICRGEWHSPSVDMAVMPNSCNSNSAMESETSPVIRRGEWHSPSVDMAVKQSPNLVDVLTEEVAHNIDSKLNLTDAPGDEGEYLAALVSGDDLSEEEIERLRSEDDRVDILDGAVVVEANSELTFESKTFPTGDGPLGMATADFDKDGKQDIVVANSGTDSDTVSVLFGDGRGGVLATSTFGVGGKPAYVAVGDFNGDRNPDIATTNFEDDNVAVLLGDGRGTFIASGKFAVGDRPFDLAVADVNGDRKLDIVTANTLGDTVSILLGNGNGSFAESISYPVKADTPSAIVVENFNSDGIFDIVVTNYKSNNISVLLGNGDGSFGLPVNFEVGGSEPTGIAAKDLNGDNKLDVVVARENSENISVMFGTGNGSFGFPNNFQVGDNPEDVAIGDLNGDGKQDIVIANQDSNNVSVLLGQGRGSFSDAINFNVGEKPLDVIVEDFNKDGKLDIATTNFDSDTISILTNTTEIPTT
ncbi:MAG: VCBS repeat-containing protein, partial [Okeania sp. SIO3C4]|nr:VCBS repeat-containing protein [Okeania sp. SIO3C4]